MPRLHPEFLYHVLAVSSHESDVLLQTKKVLPNLATGFAEAALSFLAQVSEFKSYVHEDYVAFGDLSGSRLLALRTSTIIQKWLFIYKYKNS